MPPTAPDLGEARLARRLVLYLAQQPHLGPDDIPPMSFTQAGLAERVVATQGAIAKIAARLVAAGILKEERRHVQGWPRRLSVYTLTWRGENLAHELETRLAIGPVGAVLGNIPRNPPKATVTWIGFLG